MDEYQVDLANQHMFIRMRGIRIRLDRILHEHTFTIFPSVLISEYITIILQLQFGNHQSNKIFELQVLIFSVLAIVI